MSEKLKTFKCRECGAEYQKQREQRSGRCQECGMKAVAAAMTQLHKHEGPVYEKWKARMKAAARRL